MEERAIALLGGQWPALVEQRARGLASKTPPRDPHRLVNNLRRMAASRASMERGEGPIDPAAIVEVGFFLELLGRWEGDPDWSRIVASIVDPAEYPHTVLVLATEKAFSDLGNLVVLETPSRANRSPDLRMYMPRGGTWAIEVKAPQRLRDGSYLSPRDAEKVVTGAVDSAGFGSDGQLPPDYCSQLVIGGFGVRWKDMGLLEQAGARVFRRRRHVGHIAAIVFLSLGLHLEEARVVAGKPALSKDTKAKTSMSVRLCRNPWYVGAIPFNDATPRGWSPLPPHVEIEPDDDPKFGR